MSNEKFNWRVALKGLLHDLAIAIKEMQEKKK